MKRIGTWLLLLLALAALLAVTASAADAPTKSGVYAVTVESGYTLTPQTAAGSAIAAQTASIGGSDIADFYPEAVRFQLTTPTSLSGYQLVLALEGESGVPTASNIRYLDQQTGDGATTLTFDVYPTALTGTTYAVYLAGASGTMTKVAGFTYYLSYTLGDVNDDGAINSVDALLVLQHSVHLITLNERQQLAANVNPNTDSSINSVDALLILQYSVHLIDKF